MKKTFKEDVVDLEVKKKELLEQIKPHVYPTSQIFHKQITVEEYIISISNFFSKEMLDRRMNIEMSPLFAELGVVLYKLGEFKF